MCPSPTMPDSLGGIDIMSFVKIASFAACHDGFESKCISNSMRYLSGRNMFEKFYDTFLSHCSGIKQLQSTWKILAHNKIGLFFGDPFKRSLTIVNAGPRKPDLSFINIH